MNISLLILLILLLSLFNMLQLYFVRHGQTEWNKLGIPQGSENDIELNDEGKIEALKTGIYLNKYRQKDSKFDMIISSPMKRTIETAQIIAKQINYNGDIESDNNLIEASHGNDVNQREKDEIIAGWKNIRDPIERMHLLQKYDSMIYDVCGKETTESIKNRCKIVMDNILGTGKKKILIVTHSVIIINMIRHMFNLTLEIPHGQKTGTCSVMYVTYNDSKFNLVSLSTNEHLEFIKIKDNEEIY